MDAGYITNVSGNYSSGSNTGAFNLNVNNSPSNSNANNGSHLIYVFTLTRNGYINPKGSCIQWLISSILTLPIYMLNNIYGKT